MRRERNHLVGDRCRRAAAGRESRICAYEGKRVEPRRTTCRTVGLNVGVAQRLPGWTGGTLDETGW